MMSAGAGSPSPPSWRGFSPSTSLFVALARWLTIGSAAALALAVLAGLLLILWPKGPEPVPLVNADGWRSDGGFFRVPTNAVSPLEVSRPKGGAIDFQRSWSPETSGTIGSVRTLPFPARRFLAIPFYGFPAEVVGNRIFLQCQQTGGQLDIANLRTNDKWGTAYLEVPKTFCPGPVELVAVNASTATYIGVGTPLAIGASRFYARTTVFPQLWVVFTTWAMLCSLIVVMAYPFAVFQNTDAPAGGFAVLGVSGMVLFIIFHFAPGLGRAAVWVLLGGSFCALVMIWRRDRASLAGIVRRIGTAALIWLAVALAYAAFIGAVDNGGSSWAVNALFTPLRWSSDNQLPFAFAEALYDGVPRDKIAWGAWLASDRPPLLASLLLIPRSTIIPLLATRIGTDFVPLAYQLSAITILASWAAALYYLCRWLVRKRAAFIVFLAFCTSFFLFNTVFVWPKMLGATYVLVAFGLLVRMRDGRAASSNDLVITALCGALAYLSHASNAFALIPLAAVFARVILRRGVAEIGIACAAAGLCMAPWLWWQAAIQPGGNALLRFALTNDLYSFSHRGDPLIDSVVSAYRQLGFAGWISSKLHGLAMLLGLTTDWRSFGEVAQYSPAGNLLGAARVLDFFLPPRSIGIATLGLLLAWRGMVGSRGNRDDAVAGLAAIVGVSGILLALAVMLVDAITATQAYGALLLCFLAGGLALARCNAYIRAGSLTLALAYFAIVWIGSPLFSALRVEASSIALFGISSIAVACFAWSPSITAQRTGLMTTSPFVPRTGYGRPSTQSTPTGQ
jgi:hypothetical protein